MAKVKYYYDPRTLSYRKIEKNANYRLKKTGVFLLSSAAMGALMLMLLNVFVDSPKEKRLKRENDNLVLQYEILNKQAELDHAVIAELQKRDNDIYRVIFEADPIPFEIRQAGFGGVNRYKKYDGFDFSKIIKETAKNIDKLSKSIYIQGKSFDDIVNLAENKSELLKAIPAIQPVANENLRRMASGYGMRLDPFTKAPKMHYGMDFTADIGTPVYATGDGVVIRADSKSSGFGRHIRIDHGYDYITIYGHLNKYNISVGQKVKRGEIIGFVGNSGRSSGPHLHYEVHRGGKKMNPVNYYYGELSPEEFSKIIDLASQANQSFD